MPKNYEDIQDAVLKDVAEAMCVAARTAPKTRGQDHLVITILEPKEKELVIAKMKEIAARDSRPSCERDANNLKNITYIVVIAVKNAPLGLNCSFCGYSTCEELSKTPGVCAYNAMDLGIALGSSASLAARFHVDNRLMFSIGKACMELNLLDDAVQAIGIPLSATGKNPFFDRG